MNMLYNGSAICSRHQRSARRCRFRRCHSIVVRGDERGALSISTIRFNCKRTGNLRPQVTLFNRTERDLLAPQLPAIFSV